VITVLETTIGGVKLLQPQVHRDVRGFFVESYSERELAAIGITERFVQANHSRSRRNVVRGLHYQLPPGQTKLVGVVRGTIWDVVVDIRRGSPSYGSWESFVLDDDERRLLYVPVGFAHGFCVRSEVADVTYQVSHYYEPGLERGVAWNDPQIGIDWPVDDPLVSERDQANPRLEAIEAFYVRGADG
jgi:dTDP-4-dehydrorhamnose 3,5-epimerase